MAFKHISDETDGSPLVGTDLFAIDRPGSPYLTRKVTSADIATYVASTISSGVSSITGTANQVLANGTSGSAQTGAVTLTLPQSIATTSTPQFERLGVGYPAQSDVGLYVATKTGTSCQLALWDYVDGYDGSLNQFSVLVNTIVTTGAVLSYRAFSLQPQLVLTAGAANVYGLIIDPQVVNPGTITSFYGVYSVAISATNSWAGYFVGDVESTAKIKTSTFQMTTGASNGYVMRSDASGNGSWTSLSSFGVSSATGTLQQIEVNGNSLSPQTGAITIGFPSTVSITKLGVGGTTPGTTQVVTFNVSVTAGGGFATGFQTASSSVYTCNANSNDIRNVLFSPGTIATGAFTSLEFFNLVLNNATAVKTGTGTIINYFGLYADSPAIACTSSYTGYFLAPSAGTTSNTAMYTANLSVGYTGVTPPSNGAIISGSVGIGISSASDKLHLSVGNVEGIRIQSTNCGFLRFYNTDPAANSRNWMICGNYSTAGDFTILRSPSIGTAPTTVTMTLSYLGNVGINNTNPTTAKLVISGTSGQEGLDLATSDQYVNMRVIRNSLSSIDKHMYIGYQSGATSTLNFYSNNTNAMYLSGGNLLTINGRCNVGGSDIGTLTVGRGDTSNQGTAVFLGTTSASHFNYSTAEDTYIRGGKSTSVVYVGDVNSSVRLGNTGASSLYFYSATNSTLYNSVNFRFYKEFTSSLTAIGASQTQVAHGLGAVPAWFEVWIQYISGTGNANYAAGDRIRVANYYGPGDSVNSAYANDTYVGFTCNNRIVVANKTSGVATAITLASFNLFFRAWIAI